MERVNSRILGFYNLVRQVWPVVLAPHVLPGQKGAHPPPPPCLVKNHGLAEFGAGRALSLAIRQAAGGRRRVRIPEEPSVVFLIGRCATSGTHWQSWTWIRVLLQACSDPGVADARAQPVLCSPRDIPARAAEAGMQRDGDSAATMVLSGGCREEQAPAGSSTKEKTLCRRLNFTPKQSGGKGRQLPACS